MAHANKPSTPEAGGRTLSLRPIWNTHTHTHTKKKKKKRKKKSDKARTVRFLNADTIMNVLGS